MSDFASQIVPTLGSLGVWAYWIVGLFSFLEAWWVTGVITPGSLVVDAGGVLVRLGQLDALDLFWFVAAGAILGGELGFVSARWLEGRLPRRGPAFERAAALVRRFGGGAVVIGRFLGPVSGLTVLAAALSGMEHRRFSFWNVVAALLYAAVHVALGYAAGDVLARLGPYLPRIALPLALFAVFVLLVWIAVRALRRGLPAFLAALDALTRFVGERPAVRRLAARHPRVSAFLARRLDTSHGGGLLATGVAALLLYLVAVFIDGALDLTFSPNVAQTDERLSALIHAFWTPLGLRIAGWLTQAGHVPVATLVAVGAALAFLVAGRRAAAVGFAVTVLGNAATVTLLKLAFGRSRPELMFFSEHSHSFPSGHAAISAALYGTLFALAWRERLIGATAAIVGAVTVAATIGATRLYLNEHYLTDVLNGWLVGAIWLVIGVAVAEMLRARRGAPPKARPRLALAVFAVALAGALGLAATDVPTEAPSIPPETREFTDPGAAIAEGTFATRVTTLVGDPMPPVSLVTVGPALPELVQRLEGTGWSPAPVPGPASLLAALRADLTNRPSPEAAVAPAFRAGIPAQATLVAPDAGAVLYLWPAGETDGKALVAAALAPRRGAAGTVKPAEAVTTLGSSLGATATTAVAPARDRDTGASGTKVTLLELP
ncbi:bifunctional DedA family/phosphatase PAP2 family protein [Oceaniglobus roseus]|uniref:bifunctional DedA family/phosphatase PAP2 family protein n=1 Tax=Oceaniglobus roseus TaxID=1737570 RepID=UPI000C7F4A3B|nr:bifunctional DedA family/phosphatase PAP2 family protein [Kandeliimicrobium roseum]